MPDERTCAPAPLPPVLTCAPSDNVWPVLPLFTPYAPPAPPLAPGKIDMHLDWAVRVVAGMQGQSFEKTAQAALGGFGAGDAGPAPRVDVQAAEWLAANEKQGERGAWRRTVAFDSALVFVVPPGADTATLLWRVRASLGREGTDTNARAVCPVL